MEAAITLMGRDGTCTSFHPISIRYLIEKDAVIIDIAGVDHTLLLQLGELELSKLSKAALDGKASLHKRRERQTKDRSIS